MFQKKNNREISQAIRKADEKEFHQCLSRPSDQTTYLHSLSLRALPFLLMPPRLFDIVDDPTRLSINIHWANKDFVLATVAYANPIPFLRKLEPLFPHTRLSASSDTILEIKLSSYRKKLCVIEYSDNEAYRGKGLGTSFFEHVHTCAKMMGFHCIYAYPPSEKMRFFTEKLHWLRLNQLWN
jgi:hypothetical protein